MTSDVETPVYAMVDKNLNVLVKFQYINDDWKRLDKMRREAENIIKNKNSR